MKRIWKIYQWTAIGCFSLVISSFLIVLFFSVYRPTIPKTDAVIVLGAAINTPALYNRSLKGLEIYQEGKTDMLMLSGGRVKASDISEAGYMLKTIKKNSSGSIPSLLDEQSRNTYENIKNSKMLMPGAKSVVIVSDKYHLARGVLLAKRAGFEHVYWASPPSNYYKNSELAYYYIREVFAMISYIPKFIFG